MQNNTAMTEQQIWRTASAIVGGASIGNANSLPLSLLATGTKVASSSSSPSYSTLLSTIGVGTDCNCDDVDATTAAVRAVHDAVEKLNVVPGSQYRLHIRLGAPICKDRQQVMRIDPSSLRQALPRNIPLLPVDVETGGLRIPHENSATCVVVASVTLQQQVQTIPPQQLAAMSVPTNVVTCFPPVLPQVPRVILPKALQQYQFPTIRTEDEDQQVKRKPVFRPLPLQPKVKTSMNEDPSMDAMRARISAETIVGEDKVFKGKYKKLPPGTTPTNHKRIFVKHTYQDHSHEVPDANDVDLFPRAPNAIFPVKLHDSFDAD